MNINEEVKQFGATGGFKKNDNVEADDKNLGENWLYVIQENGKIAKGQW